MKKTGADLFAAPEIVQVASGRNKLKKRGNKNSSETIGRWKKEIQG